MCTCASVRAAVLENYSVFLDQTEVTILLVNIWAAIRNIDCSRLEREIRCDDKSVLFEAGMLKRKKTSESADTGVESSIAAIGALGSSVCLLHGREMTCLHCPDTHSIFSSLQEPRFLSFSTLCIDANWGVFIPGDKSQQSVMCQRIRGKVCLCVRVWLRMMFFS